MGKTDLASDFGYKALHMTQRHEKLKVDILQAKRGYRGIGVWGKQICHQILATSSKYKIKSCELKTSS